jgi:hypothetical protein
MLSTQLGSWAELRHDTILYAEQSYTTAIPICSFPDAYVDPYPLFYDRLETFAHQGQALVRALDFGKNAVLHDGIDAFFHRLGDVTAKLGGIARREEKGDELSASDLGFINRAVSEDTPVRSGCGGGSPEVIRGWYIDLFYAQDADRFRPTIADVHTQPTDENGGTVGRVLHVGTGEPRLMVVKVDRGGSPRLYTGVVSSYFEFITDGFERLTDERWKSLVELRHTRGAPPPDVAGPHLPDDVRWMRDLVGGDPMKPQ